MKVDQKKWNSSSGWQETASQGAGVSTQLVLMFGAPGHIVDDKLFQEVHKAYPGALIVGCTTSGEICGSEVNDDSLVATAIHFEHTSLMLANAQVDDSENSFAVGVDLAHTLNTGKLSHVLVLSDGLNVNGTELARGLREDLPEKVAVTGGLAGDGDRFQRTLVSCNGVPLTGQVAAIGFYGDRLRIGWGSLGGWDTFGPERLITRAKGNVLYELDNESALGLYKMYLGYHASSLPGSALLFPLALRSEHGGYGVVRTVLGIDELDKSMTFAGDIPEGTYARLMKANFDRLIDGAAEAAHYSLAGLDSFAPDLAVLISCVGRKLVLKQRIEEEVEAVRDMLGPQAVLTGFYSYGEICPHGTLNKCELHNQTMTITAFSES
jgi:hypothetical protein